MECVKATQAYSCVDVGGLENLTVLKLANEIGFGALSTDEYGQN